MKTRSPNHKTRWILGSLVVVALIAAGTLFAIFKRAGDSSTTSPPKVQAGPTVEAVFLIVIDTLRADRLSCYGYTDNQTPHFDRVAQMGVRFTRAHTVASWTCPSMGAMLTSLYPGQLGMLEKPASPGQRFKWREHRPQLSNRVPPYAPTIAQMLRSQGFQTAAFVNQPALNASHSFARGFQEYFYPVSKDEIRRRSPESQQRVFQRWATNNFTGITDEKLVDHFVDWLALHGREKIFVWVHLMAPHVPYAPPAPFAPPPLPDGTNASTSQRYDGEVRFTDSLVGRMLQAIEQHAHLDRSVIVLTSDHGEEFGDHGHHGHGHSFYREVNRVPLILAAPGVLKPATVHADVRIIDIVPTLLELTGLRGLSGGLSGTTLTSMMSGQPEPLPTFAEGKLYGDTQRSLIDGGFKLIASEVDGRYELYDVVADPQELNDLAAQDAQRVAVLLDRMRQWKSQMERYRRQALTGMTQPDAKEVDLQRQRTMDALRSLGYLDGDDGQ